MVRHRRLQLPGVVFHVTTRTQGRVNWFTPSLRSRIVVITAETLREYADARLLAFCVMPNHLHLVVQQGEAGLGRIMQPLLRRVARLVQREHGVEGHVFERRYRAQPCLTPEYLRNAIVYTHLNPVRAGLCGAAGEYPWSSHRNYVAGSGWRRATADVLVVTEALELFRTGTQNMRPQLRYDYSRYVAWRLSMDRHEASMEKEHPAAPLPRPSTSWGDQKWARCFAPRTEYVRAAPPPLPCGRGPDEPATTDDLTTFARAALSECGVDLELDDIRGRHCGRTATRVRRHVIARMSAAGFQGGLIARHLGVSPSTVSKTLAGQRSGASS